MEGWLPIVFLGLVLKIPVFAAMYLVWYAIRAEPDIEEAPGEEQDHGFRRWRREPRGPRGPRRGPHGGNEQLPACPPGGRRRTEPPAGAPARQLSRR